MGGLQTYLLTGHCLGMTSIGGSSVEKALVVICPPNCLRWVLWGVTMAPKLTDLNLREGVLFQGEGRFLFPPFLLELKSEVGSSAASGSRPAAGG